MIGRYDLNNQKKGDSVSPANPYAQHEISTSNVFSTSKGGSLLQSFQPNMRDLVNNSRISKRTNQNREGKHSNNSSNMISVSINATDLADKLEERGNQYDFESFLDLVGGEDTLGPKHKRSDISSMNRSSNILDPTLHDQSTDTRKDKNSLDVSLRERR